MFTPNTFAADIEPFTRDLLHSTMQVTDDIVGLRSLIVNVYFVDVPGVRGARKWVLIDAGLPISGHAIRSTATRIYGENARPEAILLTHAHFDHTGALKTLAEEWDVPVFAHPLELPYLTGRASYAPPDPWVGGGMALTSPLYPRGPVDLGERVSTLPEDGSVPFLEGWRWIATPGHSPGHVSFFRESDRVLIAGDAFVTTKQESVLSVLTQAQAVFGPPKYFTHDWQAAEQSVRTLAELEPNIAATGHGTPMNGDKLRQQLHALADHFAEVSIPKDGRYAGQPVISDENGPQEIPPAKPIPPAVYVVAGVAAVAMLALAVSAVGKDDHQDRDGLAG